MEIRKCWVGFSFGIRNSVEQVMYTYICSVQPHLHPSGVDELVSVSSGNESPSYGDGAFGVIGCCLRASMRPYIDTRPLAPCMCTLV